MGGALAKHEAGMATKLPPSTALRAIRGEGGGGWEGEGIPHARSGVQLTVELCVVSSHPRGREGEGGAGGRGGEVALVPYTSTCWEVARVGSGAVLAVLSMRRSHSPSASGPARWCGELSAEKEYGFIKVHHSNNRIPSLYPIHTDKPHEHRTAHVTPTPAPPI